MSQETIFALLYLLVIAPLIAKFVVWSATSNKQLSWSWLLKRGISITISEIFCLVFLISLSILILIFGKNASVNTPPWNF